MSASRGSPGGFEPRSTSPKPFRSSLDALLDDLDSAPMRQTESLLDRWPEVVGADRAGHVQIVKVQSGVLVLEADDPAYGQAVEWDERNVLRRLAGVVGEGQVHRLEVRIRRSGG
jgi:hypothetical protein